MRAILALLAVLIIAPAAHAQEPGSPRWVVDRYLDPAGFSEMAAYPDRELAIENPEDGTWPATLGQRLPPGTDLSVRALQESDTLAVYGVTAVYDGKVQDFYLYASPAGERWRLDALRALSLPGFLYDLQDELEAHAEPRPDSVNAMLGPLRLLMAPDAELRAFAQRHRAAFDAIAGALRDLPPGTRVEADEGPAQLSAQLRALHLTSATHRPDGSVELLVGGILDNAVGFLWLPEGAAPPPIQPVETILVEPVGGGWVLTKTT